DPFILLFFLFLHIRTSSSTHFPYTTLFRSGSVRENPANFFPLIICGRYSFFWPGLLNWRTPSQQVPWIASDRAVLAHAFPHISRSEEHTSELQSRSDLVCRLLLEKIKDKET